MSECVVVMKMEMPERCYDCDLAEGLTCMATGGYLGRDIPKMTFIKRRPDWCPIICALPENHGRLVDADAMFDKVYEFYGYDNEDNENWMMGMINDAPTIVPATETEATPCP